MIFGRGRREGQPPVLAVQRPAQREVALEHDTKSPLLSIREVKKVFHTRHGSVVALDNLNLDFRKGQITCLLGPSGCGKTTVLRMLAGFERPTYGSVTMRGHTVDRPAPSRPYVFQSPTLFPWLNVWNNITLELRVAGKGRQEMARARELISALGLEGFERNYPYELSGGMAQRAQIARALVADPEVLLLDEPFGALDAQTRSSAQELLQQIHLRYRPTIVFVTHDIEESLILGDQVVVLSGRPASVLEALSVDLPHPRTYITTTRPDFVEMKAELTAIIRGEVWQRPESIGTAVRDTQRSGMAREGQA